MNNIGYKIDIKQSYNKLFLIFINIMFKDRRILLFQLSFRISSFLIILEFYFFPFIFCLFDELKIV